MIETRYTVDNTSKAGRPVKHVFDANGKEYTYCLECVVETGYILRFKDRTRTEKETLTVPAPLKVVFY